MKNNNILFYLSQSPEVMTLDFSTLFFCKLSLYFLNNMLFFLKQKSVLDIIWNTVPAIIDEDWHPYTMTLPFSQNHYFRQTNIGDCIYISETMQRQTWNSASRYWHNLLASIYSNRLVSKPYRVLVFPFLYSILFFLEFLLIFLFLLRCLPCCYNPFFLHPQHTSTVLWSPSFFLETSLELAVSLLLPSGSQASPGLSYPGTSLHATSRLELLIYGSHIYMSVCSSTHFQNWEVFLNISPFWVATPSLPKRFRVISLPMLFAKFQNYVPLSESSFIHCFGHSTDHLTLDTAFFSPSVMKKYSWMLHLLDCSSIFLNFFSHLFQILVFFIYFLEILLALSSNISVDFL